MSIEQRVHPKTSTLGHKRFEGFGWSIDCAAAALSLGSRSGIAGEFTGTRGFTLRLNCQMSAQGNIRPVVFFGSGIGVGQQVGPGQVSQFSVTLEPPSDRFSRLAIAFNDAGEVPRSNPDPRVRAKVSGNRATIENEVWFDHPVPVGWWCPGGAGAMRGMYYDGGYLSLAWDIIPGGALEIAVGTAHVEVPVLVGHTAWGPPGATPTGCLGEWGTLRLDIPYVRGAAFPGEVFVNTDWTRRVRLGDTVDLPLTIVNPTRLALTDVGLTCSAGAVLEPSRVEHDLGRLDPGEELDVEQVFESVSIGTAQPTVGLSYAVQPEGADGPSPRTVPAQQFGSVAVYSAVEAAVEGVPNPCRGGQTVALTVQAANAGSVDIANLRATLDTSSLSPHFRVSGEHSNPIVDKLGPGESAEKDFELIAGYAVGGETPAVTPKVRLDYDTGGISQSVEVLGTELEIATVTPPIVKMTADHREVEAGNPVTVRVAIANRSETQTLPPSLVALEEPEELAATLECVSAPESLCPPLGPGEEYTLPFEFRATNAGCANPQFTVTIGEVFVLEGVGLQ